MRRKATVADFEYPSILATEKTGWIVKLGRYEQRVNMRKPAPLRLDDTYNGDEGGRKRMEWPPGQTTRSTRRGRRGKR